MHFGYAWFYPYDVFYHVSTTFCISYELAVRSWCLISFNLYFLCISPDEFAMSRLISEFRYCQPDLSIIMSLISILKTNKNPKQGRYRSLSSPLKFPNLPQFNYFSEIFTIVFPVQEPVVNSIEAIFVSGFFHLFTYFYCMNMSVYPFSHEKH